MSIKLLSDVYGLRDISKRKLCFIGFSEDDHGEHDEHWPEVIDDGHPVPTRHRFSQSVLMRSREEKQRLWGQCSIPCVHLKRFGSC